MRVLGIDPGHAILGYGIIDNTKVVTYGVIETSKDDTEENRLLKIYNNLYKIVDQFKPNELAMESLFFNKNVTTAISVGQARGIVMLIAAQKGIKVFNYTPSQIKQGVSGYGRSTKKDIQFMVKMILELDEIPQPDDAADALAIAITHVNRLNNNAMLLDF